MTVKRNDFIGGAFFLAIGFIFAVYSRTVEIGTMEEPGPGFLPFWAGIILILLSCSLLIKTFFSKGIEADAFFPESDSWKRVCTVVGSLIAYNLLLNYLGFNIVTFLFVVFLVRFVFPQTWLKTFITALLSTLGAWFVFVKLLKIQFPKGLLGF